VGAPILQLSVCKSDYNCGMEEATDFEQKPRSLLWYQHLKPWVMPERDENQKIVQKWLQRSNLWWPNI